MISVTVSVLLSYPPSSIVTFPTENTCISLTSEALDPLPNAAYHEVIEILASLFPAASCTAGTGIQCSWRQGSPCILSKQLHISRGIFSATSESYAKFLFLNQALPLDCYLRII